MTILLALVSGALALVVAIYLYGRRPLARYKYRHIPGPPAEWLYGNTRRGDFVGPKRIFAFAKAAKTYGKVFKVWLGAQPTIVISDAELGRLVLLRNQTRTEIGGPPIMTLSKTKLRRFRAGLFNVQDVKQHKALKHAWMPSMNSDTLAGNAALMESSAARMADLLAAPAQRGENIDIWRAYGDMTLDVVGTAAFGVQFNTLSGGQQDPQAAELVKSVKDIFRHAGSRACIWVKLVDIIPELAPLFIALSLVFPGAALTESRGAGEHLDSLTHSLLQDARAKAAGQGVHINVDAGSGAGPPAGAAKKPRGVKPGSFPTMMISAKDPATGQTYDNNVAGAQVNTFLLAGYETTATSLAFTTYALASHPEKLTKLHEELDSRQSKAPLTVADLDSLPYLEACYKEAMRLYPPVPNLERTADADQVLGGYKIPKGTKLLVPLYSIHRGDSDLWPQPDEYIPERWIEGHPLHHKIPAGAWMPFGEGTRICAGQRFALQEIKITLARIMSRYSFRIAAGQGDLQIGIGFTLQPQEGVINVVPILR